MTRLTDADDINRDALSDRTTPNPAPPGHAAISRNGPRFPGVVRCRRRKKWRAYLRANKVKTHLGYYDTAVEAYAAVMAEKARREVERREELARVYARYAP